MDDFEAEIKSEFLNEASDLLQNIEKSFLELETDPTNSVLIDMIFRFAHNLKGTSRAVGFGQIAEVTHKAENLLLEIKQEKIHASGHVVSVLLSFNDKVREMVEGLKQSLDATFECHDLLVELDKVIAGDVGGAASDVSTSQAPSADLIEENFEVSEVTETSDAAVEEVVPHNVVAMPVKAAEKKEIKKPAKKDDETLRVSVDRLEKLNDLVGELAILKTLVESSLSKAGDTKTARSLDKLCKDIQDLSMSLRMVPVGPTFQKLNRIVRDTSKILNKKVELKLIGEDTEIDKTVVESLGDPLVHIIRNAIDHGVESPEERVAAGKNEQGIVEIMAFHEGNYLIIQITDDGKGIDPNRLIAKAKAKGLIPANAQLTDQQGIELIFHPGFSTKEEVSEVSGRGVGMDVVKTNIEELGGEVKVRSKLGSGSCFRLILPLTLAIIDGMLIESSSQTYVVPKNQVLEVVRIEQDQVLRTTGRIPSLVLRESIIPLFSLDQTFGFGQAEDPKIAVIIKHGDCAFAVSISDVLKLQQVVIKPPTRELHAKQGVMGTTILGDGKPSLILDMVNLFGKLARKENITEKRAS